MASFQSMPCHVDPSISNNILNEDILHKESACCFKEADTGVKIDHLELHITTHRVRLFHPINTIFNFEFYYENMRNVEIQKRGFISKMVYKVVFQYQGRNYGVKLMSRGNLEQQANILMGAFNNRSRWEQVRLAPQVNYKTGTNILTNHLNESKAMVQNQASKVNASFTSFDAFLRNLEQLEAVFSVVSRSLKEDKQFIEQTKQSEADKMLSDLGAVDVVLKGNDTRQFYQGVAVQIEKIFEPIVAKSGGAMGLLDVFLYYNRMRGAELITPDDLLQSCRVLNSNSYSKLYLEESTGVKLLQFRVTDVEADFYKYCQVPLQSKQRGLSVEDLVKMFGISLIVARHKLDGYVKQGRLVVDSSVEGTRFYLNDIVSCDIN